MKVVDACRACAATWTCRSCTATCATPGAPVAAAAGTGLAGALRSCSPDAGAPWFGALHVRSCLQGVLTLETCGLARHTGSVRLGVSS